MAYAKRKYSRGKSPRRSAYGKRSKPAAIAVKRKSRKAVAPRYKLTRPMRSLVDARVNLHLETRTVKASLWPPVKGTSYNFANAISDVSVATIIPRIKQAQSPEQLANASVPFREGNQICPKYCSLRIRLWVDPNDTTYGIGAGDRCMIQPYLFVGTHRSLKDYDSLTENNWECLEQFWRDQGGFVTTDDPSPGGLGNSGLFTGERGVFVQGCLNREKFSPITGGVKTFMMNRPLGWSVNTNQDPSAGAGFTIPYVGRDFTFKIPMPKVLKYDKNDAEYPANYCPFVAVGFTYHNGAPPSDEKPLLCESQVTFTFTDA